MRLFGYYVCHTFINQLRKLFKTWVLIFLIICALVGGLVGFGAAKLDEAAEQQNPQAQEEQDKPEIPMEEKLGVSPEELTELIAGGVVLAIFAFCALRADKNGCRIFLPADVNLLFASPMKPQSVLMFRLMTQMGLALLGGVWLAIEIPTLVVSMGISAWAAVGAVAAWCMAVAVGSLIEVLLYTVCSTHIQMKKYIRQFVWGLLLVLGLGYFAYWKTSDYTCLQAACAFFNHPGTRLIPFWGWLKGLCMFSVEGNLTGVLLSLTAIILGGIVLVYAIWHVKADFYEDAMAKSQETAARMEAAQSEKTIVQKRKKDRSDKLRRDEMGHGWGASVFFWKSMYNRIRFAHLHVFTKTSETYLAAALAVAAVCRFIFEIPGTMPVCLTLGVFVFFRALGNPLDQDTGLDFFRMIPESSWQKLFWSLLGGTVNCLLDLIPGIAAATLLLWENPLGALAWIPVIVSVDFFSTTVGTFIDLSVPVSAGKMIKQLVQVMFVYFGILPDVAIMAAGIVYKHVPAAALGTTAFNLALGFAFLALIPLFIEPKEGKKMEEKHYYTGDLKPVRKQFSRMGMAAFLFLAASTGAQLLVGAVVPQQIIQDPLWMWVCNFAPIYLVGLPVCLLCLKKVPAEHIPQKKMKAGHWCIAMLIGVFFMYLGNYAGILVLTAIQKIFHATAVNPMDTIAVHQLLIPKILVMVIIGPIVEEYVFRKQLIDRMHPYGEKLAVFTTAVLFGLFHGNLSQFFYAFTLGLAFGFIYLKTGKLRYTIAMHMTINFMGGVIAPMYLEHLDMEALDQVTLTELVNSNLPWIGAFLIHTALMVAAAIAGLVLLCANHRKITFETARLELPPKKKFRTVYGNTGMILIIAACIALTVSTFLV